MAEDCLFCRIAGGEMDAEIVYRDDDVVAFDDVNPQAPTHVLVIPRRHIETVNDLQNDDRELVGKLVTVARDIAAERGHDEAGYRVLLNCNAAAGQSVFHIHLHLLAGRRLGWPPG